MKNSLKTHLSLILLILLVLNVCGCSRKPVKKVCIKGTCIFAEIPQTKKEMSYGLMFRKGLAGNRGMLFIFQKEGIYSFWMKNMVFPLDIIWIGADRKIADIRRNALPCRKECLSLIPKANAKFVLEVNSGFVEKNRIRVGDRVYF